MFIAMYTPKLEASSFKTEAEMDEFALEYSRHMTEAEIREFIENNEYRIPITLEEELERQKEYDPPIVFGFEANSMDDLDTNKFIRPVAIYMRGQKYPIRKPIADSSVLIDIDQGLQDVETKPLDTLLHLTLDDLLAMPEADRKKVLERVFK